MNTHNLTNTQRSFFIPSHWLDRELKIALIGLGGTGSAMLTELFQMSGILSKIGGKPFIVDAYDGDLVSESNILRQSFWAHDIGQNKAEVLINRFNQFGGIEWNAIPEFFNGDHCKNNKYDLIITAVDKASVRYEIGEALSKQNNNALWLDLGNDNHQANVLMGSASGYSDSTPLPSPFQLFGQQWLKASKNEVDTASCSTHEAIQKQTFGVNGMTARSAASMILFPLLRYGKIDHHGLFIDLHEADISKMPVDPLQWSIYGFHEDGSTIN